MSDKPQSIQGLYELEATDNRTSARLYFKDIPEPVYLIVGQSFPVTGEEYVIKVCRDDDGDLVLTSIRPATKEVLSIQADEHDEMKTAKELRG